MNTLRDHVIRLAATFPKGSFERESLLTVLKSASTDKEAKSRLDGVRGHTLMPANIRAKLPAIYSQDGTEDPIVWLKLFSPYGNGRATWYVTEFDGDDTMFGWANLGFGGELGYISLSELENSHKGGLPLVERDTSWRPVRLSQAKGK